MEPDNEGLTFSQVLDALTHVQDGKVKRAWRKGWNGKGMFIFQHLGEHVHPVELSDYMQAILKSPDNCVTLEPYLAIKTAQGTVSPWRPTQPDMHTADWEIEIQEGVDW